MEGKQVLQKVKKGFIGFFKDEAPEEENGATKKKSVSNIVLTVLGIVICAILIPVLVINVTLTIKGKSNTEKVASIFGYVPMIVLSGSMERTDDLPDIKEGDLIFLKEIDSSKIRNNDILLNEDKNAPLYVNGKIQLKSGVAPLAKDDVVFVPGDVIAFLNRDTMGDPILDENGAYTYVTHRIHEFKYDEELGILQFATMGDYTQSLDTNTVPLEDVVGWYNFHRDQDSAWTTVDEYKGARLRGIGNFVEWISTPPGIAVMVGVPVVAFIIYDIIRRQFVSKKALKAQLAKQEAAGGKVSSLEPEDSLAENIALKAELEAMKKEKAEQEARANEQSEAEKMKAELEELKRKQAEQEAQAKQKAEADRMRAELEELKRKQAEQEAKAKEQSEADKLRAELEEIKRKQAEQEELEILKAELAAAKAKMAAEPAPEVAPEVAPEPASESSDEEPQNTEVAPEEAKPEESENN